MDELSGYGGNAVESSYAQQKMASVPTLRKRLDLAVPAV